MFDCGGDDVTAVRLQRLASSGDRQIVCFSSARRENDLVCVRANERGYLPPRSINCRTCFLTKHVDA